jgi:hypothetical protein
VKEGVCLGITGIWFTKIWELIEMVGWVVPKIDSITKIGTWLNLWGQFPTTRVELYKKCRSG